MRVFVIAATACAVLLAGASVIVWLTLKTAADQLEAIEADKAELAIAFAELDATYPAKAFDADRLARFLEVRRAISETYNARKRRGEDPEPLNPRLRLDMLKTLKSELTFAQMGRAEYVGISKRVRAAVLAAKERFKTLADRYKAFGEQADGPKANEKDFALVEKSSAALRESMSGEWILILLADLEEK